MAVVFVNSDRVGGSNVTDVTRSRTVPSGENQVLVVCVSSEDSSSATHGNVNGVTFNGVSLDYLTNGGGGLSSGSECEVWVFYMLNPPATTANIVVDRAGEVNGSDVTSIVVSGVDLNDPFADVETDYEGGNTTSFTINADCLADSVLLGYAAVSTGSGINNAGGQTSIFTNSSDGYSKAAAYKNIASAGSNSLGYSFSGSRGGLVGIAFRPFVPAVAGSRLLSMMGVGS